MLLHQDLTGIETKSLDEDTQKNIAMFTGVASTADKDLTDDIIEPGAFGKIDPKFVRLLRDHDMRKPIGKWHKFEQKGKQLHVEGEIGLDFETGLETYKLLKHDYINGLSVGFRLKKGGLRWDEENDVRYIKSATLLECSVVSIPANQNARTHSIKSLTRDDWREWLHDYGLRDADINTVMKHGFDALLKQGSDNDKEPPDPKPNESREKFMARCMRAGHEMAACAEAWKESENDDDDNDKHVAAFANEAKLYAEAIRGSKP